jgi:hypothetical protein
MDSRTRLKTALFGVRDGIGWVSQDVFVTRQAGTLLVEGWVGRRLVSIHLGGDFRSEMPTVWSKLNEVAIDDG